MKYVIVTRSFNATLVQLKVDTQYFTVARVEPRYAQDEQDDKEHVEHMRKMLTLAIETIQSRARAEAFEECAKIIDKYHMIGPHEAWRAAPHIRDLAAEIAKIEEK